MKRILAHKAFQQLVLVIVLLAIVTFFVGDAFKVPLLIIWAALLLVALPLRIYTIAKGHHDG